MNRYLVRLPEVKRLTGLSRSSIYAQVAAGLLPRPVKISQRSIAWPSDELHAVVDARRAGRNEGGIRLLVNGLEKARTAGDTIEVPS